MSDRANRYWWLGAVFAAASSLGVGVDPGISQTPVGTADNVLELARSQQLDQLQRQIGRFVSGGQAIYEGKLSATERGTGRRELTLPMGRVVASLVAHDRAPGANGPGVILTVVSAGQGLWIRLSQLSEQPGVTWSTLLRPLAATAGSTASCSGCLADLSTQPQTLAFDRFVAVGRLRDIRGSKFLVEVSGRLERVPSTRLRLADLEALNPGLESVLRDEVTGFTRRGGEGVRRVERQLRHLVPPPQPSAPQTRCERVTHYSAERFVDLADLSRYGVRDLRIVGTEICCLDHDSHGELEQCTAEGRR